jgi:very-short-patch-repair endonuclease
MPPNPAQLRCQRTQRARDLRQTQTLYEARLWAPLRDRRLQNYKFRRQHPIDRFVADFACIQAKLVVELDGNSHDDRIEQDAARDEFLSQNGWHTLRIRNAHLMRNGEGVVLTPLSLLET